MGGFSHTLMHKIKIKRHGKAAGLILHTVKDSKKINVAIFADAETVEKSLDKISRNLLPRKRSAEALKHQFSLINNRYMHAAKITTM